MVSSLLPKLPNKAPTNLGAIQYFRFSLGLCDVEDLLAERGITVSHETVRFWVVKFSRQYAKSIR